MWSSGAHPAHTIERRRRGGLCRRWPMRRRPPAGRCATALAFCLRCWLCAGCCFRVGHASWGRTRQLCGRLAPALRTSRRRRSRRWRLRRGFRFSGRNEVGDCAANRDWARCGVRARGA